MKPYKLNTVVPLNEKDSADLKLTVDGLSNLFTKFLYKHPTNSADTTLNMLITHLKHHYEQPVVLEHLYSIRLKVIF